MLSFSSTACVDIFLSCWIFAGIKVDPVYISEIAPAKHRGYLVTWSEIAINAGIVLGFSMGIFFAGVETGSQVCILGRGLGSVSIFKGGVSLINHIKEIISIV